MLRRSSGKFNRRYVKHRLPLDIFYLLTYLVNFLIASEGDLRRAITFLQSIANLNSEACPTIEDIYEITGVSIFNNNEFM